MTSESIKLLSKSLLNKGRRITQINMSKTVLTSFTVFCLSFTVFLFGSALNIQTVKASGAIYIKADGSIDPPTTNIMNSDNFTYTFIGNVYDEIVVERDNIVIDGVGYTLQGTGNGTGIDLSDRSNVAVQNVIIKMFLVGIRLSGSSKNIISGNNLTANSNHGIWFGNSSNYNILFGNYITQNSNGIMLADSFSNTIWGNTITNNGYGVYLSESSENVVNGNELMENQHGVLIYNSFNNMFRGNSIDNNDYNIGLSATQFPTLGFINDVDESNTVNDRPVYYWIERRDDKIPANAGYVVLVNSANVTVEKLNLTHNVQGILIVNSTKITIQDNFITENSYGIHLASASNNYIVRNNIGENGDVGIYLWPWSSNNTIANNNIKNNWRGISISDSSNNAIHKNSIMNNDYGIRLFNSSRNTIYQNNFINNTSYQASVTMSSYQNIWDSDYASGGNYWGEYHGIDLLGGPYQSIAGSDGIGDALHEIDENNTDNYPLMGMFSEFNAISEYRVQIISNSTISDFHFNGNAIHFKVISEAGTTGFCRICIPTALINDSFRVFVNGTEILPSPEPLPFSNSTHNQLYFTYNNSIQEIVIVPEFPFLILPLFLIATLEAAVLCRRKHSMQRMHQH